MTNARKQEWIKKMSERLTDDDLVAIEDAARHASPAPWILAVTPEEWSQEEIAANQTKMVREGGPRAHFCIHPEDAEVDESRVTAFCGNGPMSEANARFIEIAVVAVPMLVSELRRLRASRSSPGEDGAPLKALRETRDFLNQSARDGASPWAVSEAVGRLTFVVNALSRSPGTDDGLREALSEAIDAVQWMSGADAFAETGEAHEGWVSIRSKLDRWRRALTSPVSSSGETGGNREG